MPSASEVLADDRIDHVIIVTAAPGALYLYMTSGRVHCYALLTEMTTPPGNYQGTKSGLALYLKNAGRSHPPPLVLQTTEQWVTEGWKRIEARGPFPVMVVVKGIIGDPKTEASRRTVGLVDDDVDLLRARRQRMLSQQHPGLRNGWVFPRPDGEHYRGYPLRKALNRACKAAGITIRFTTHGPRPAPNLQRPRPPPRRRPRRPLRRGPLLRGHD